MVIHKTGRKIHAAQVDTFLLGCTGDPGDLAVLYEKAALLDTVLQDNFGVFKNHNHNNHSCTIAFIILYGRYPFNGQTGKYYEDSVSVISG